MKILIIIISILIASSAFAETETVCKTAYNRMSDLVKNLKKGDAIAVPESLKADSDTLYYKCPYDAGRFEYITGASRAMGENKRPGGEMRKETLCRHVNVVQNGTISVGYTANGTPHQTAYSSQFGKTLELGGKLANTEITYIVRKYQIVAEQGRAETYKGDSVRQMIQGYLDAKHESLSGYGGMASFTHEAASFALTDRPVLRQIGIR